MISTKFCFITMKAVAAYRKERKLLFLYFVHVLYFVRKAYLFNITPFNLTRITKTLCKVSRYSRDHCRSQKLLI